MNNVFAECVILLSREKLLLLHGGNTMPVPIIENMMLALKKTCLSLKFFSNGKVPFVQLDGSLFELRLTDLLFSPLGHIFMEDWVERLTDLFSFLIKFFMIISSSQFLGFLILSQGFNVIFIMYPSMSFQLRPLISFYKSCLDVVMR